MRLRLNQLMHLGRLSQAFCDATYALVQTVQDGDCSFVLSVSAAINTGVGLVDL